MSDAERHSMLFVAEIHVASRGADQLSFGATRPPRAAMVAVICEWRSGKARVGSAGVEEVEDVGDGGAEKIPESVSLRSGEEEGGEGGRRMPSERR